MITQFKDQCWIVQYPAGPGDYEPHHDSEREAQAQVEDDRERHEQSSGQVLQVAAPCWQLVTVCGTVVDEDGEGYQVHFPTEDEARSIASDPDIYGVRELPDGRWIHVSPYGSDDECTAAEREVAAAADA